MFTRLDGGRICHARLVYTRAMLAHVLRALVRLLHSISGTRRFHLVRGARESRDGEKKLLACTITETTGGPRGGRTRRGKEKSGGSGQATSRLVEGLLDTNKASGVFLRI